MQKAVFAWSSGKDSAYGLQKVMENDNIKVCRLFTTITKNFSRVAIHGTSEKLLDKQAKKIGIPLDKIYLSKDCTSEDYEKKMKDVLKGYEEEFDLVIFSDLFLEDVKENREKQFQGLDLEGHWPIWKKDTEKVAEKIVENGFKAITVCINDNKLDKNFVGRKYNKQFLEDLPPSADPCGEKGEFHTFIYDAPYIDSPLEIEIGAKVTKPVATGKNHYVKLEESV